VEDAQEEFPNSAMLFCQWHVLKVLFKQLTDAGVEKAQRDLARNVIRSVMYAKDKFPKEKGSRSYKSK